MKRSGVVLVTLLAATAFGWAQTPAQTPATPAAPSTPVAPNAPVVTSKSVFLEAVESTGSSRTVNHWRDISGNYSQTKTSSKQLNITVRNMSALPGDFEIEWYFFGKPASGSGRFLYDQGSKKVTINPGAFETFPVDSKELSSHTVRDYYWYGYNYTSGDKSDGWVIRAKVGEEVIRLKASNSVLEQMAADQAGFAKLTKSTKGKK